MHQASRLVCPTVATALAGITTRLDRDHRRWRASRSRSSLPTLPTTTSPTNDGRIRFQLTGCGARCGRSSTRPRVRPCRAVAAGLDPPDAHPVLVTATQAAITATQRIRSRRIMTRVSLRAGAGAARCRLGGQQHPRRRCRRQDRRNHHTRAGSAHRRTARARDRRAGHWARYAPWKLGGGHSSRPAAASPFNPV